MSGSTIWDLRAEKVVSEIRAGKRSDGRAFDQYRNIELETNMIESAEGSARVKFGQTDVIVGVKMFPETPYPDMPDEGSISVNCELLPMASTDYESGPPSESSIELARVVDRGIRESQCMDFKEFCIVEGEKVWVVYIEINVLNYDGNLFDAASFAAMAALKHTKVPKLDDEYQIVKGEFEGTLKLARTSLMTTYAKIGNSIIVDPDEAEEKAMSARFSIATTNDGYISAFQKGLSGSFTVDEINKCVDDAFKHTSALMKHLR